MRRLVVVLCLAVAVLGCGDATGPEGPNVSGRWIGTAGGLSFELGLLDSAGVITGGGNLRVGSGRLSVNIRGTHRKRTVAFSLAAVGYESAGYAGEIVSNAQITGHLSESGFHGQALNLVKD